MRIAILTNEYPPNVYGGAGVHVEYLTRELSRLGGEKHPVKVLCFGEQKAESPALSVTGVKPAVKIPSDDPRHELFLDTMLRDLLMAGLAHGVDIAHCHTWYSHFAGLLVKQLQGASLVLTTHSLEPHRPWKAEQLGSAYHASSWIEKTAYQNADGVIAVSESMRKDVHELYGVPYNKIRVIYNGIDAEEFAPAKNAMVLDKYGIDSGTPYILFVGRVTRQKGIIHLVNAVKHLSEGIQVVLCAGSPDTKEIGAEMEQEVAMARTQTKNKIVWIREMVPKQDLIPLYSQASVFVCPSVYEPFGIINLEAMACEVPVVASKVGGIPEVVVPGKTGLLVPFRAAKGSAEPADPARFSKDLASAVNSLMADPDKLKKYGTAARKRVVENFDWKIIASRTLDFYKELRNEKKGR